MKCKTEDLAAARAAVRDNQCSRAPVQAAAAARGNTAVFK